MYRMQFKKEIFEFDWDNANLSKSYFKHKITPKETEEVFLDRQSIVLPDIKHSQNEQRFIIVGKTFDQKNLFVVFTRRTQKIRVISARRMHKK